MVYEPQQFVLLHACSNLHKYERYGGGYYMVQGHECVFMLSQWNRKEFDLTSIIEFLISNEDLDPRTTTFFELCTGLVYEAGQKGDAWFRRFQLCVADTHETAIVVDHWDYEMCSPAMQEAFLTFLGTVSFSENEDVLPEHTEEQSQKLLPQGVLLEFHEITYPNPRQEGFDDLDCKALYAFIDNGTCIYTSLGIHPELSWSDAPIIVAYIIEQEGVCPDDVIFYDTTPHQSGWVRISVSGGNDGDLAFDIELSIIPNPRFVRVIEEEVAWYEQTIKKGGNIVEDD